MSAPFSKAEAYRARGAVAPPRQADVSVLGRRRHDAVALAVVEDERPDARERREASNHLALEHVKVRLGVLVVVAQDGPRGALRREAARSAHTAALPEQRLRC